jgi:hypothetical protein
MSYIEQVRSLLKPKCDNVDTFFEVFNEIHEVIGSSRRFGYQPNVARRLELSAADYIALSGFTGHPTDAHPFYVAVPGQNEIYAGNAWSLNSRQHDILKETFWWHREQLRIKFLYPPRSDVLNNVVSTMGLQAFCIHPSTDPDSPYAISYTPDPTFGKADRQLKVSSLGKLLRKMCPLLTDTHITMLEASHRASMDPHFEVATTETEIIEVYMNMTGDSGCMRYDAGHWGLPDGMHPAMVWASPNIAVAYTKNSFGEVASRSIIFERPDGQKCYLRVYGDSVLKTKLMRSGYVQSDLSGMKIRAIPHPASKYKGLKNQWLVPYIDGPGGDQSNENGVYGYIDSAEPEFIRLISTDQRASITRLFPHINGAVAMLKHHQSVHAQLTPITVEPWTCALSGSTYSPLSDGAPAFAWIAGELRTVSVGPAMERGWANTHRTLDAEERLIRVFTDPGASIETFTDWRSMDSVIDTPRNRKLCGYIKLHPDYYPNDPSWHRIGGEIIAISASDGNDYGILKEDAGIRMLRDKTWEFAYLTAGIAKAECATGQWVQTLVYNSMRCIAHADHPDLVTIRSGRKAVRSHHDVVECYDGTWTTPRMAHRIAIMGIPIHVPVDVGTATVYPSRSIVTKQLLRDRTSVKEYTNWTINNYVGPDGAIDDVIAGVKTRLRGRAVSLFNLGRDYSYPATTMGANGPVLIISDRGVNNWTELVSRVEHFRAAIDSWAIENPEVTGMAELALLLVDIVNELTPQVETEVPRLMHEVFATIDTDEYEAWLARYEAQRAAPSVTQAAADAEAAETPVV